MDLREELQDRLEQGVTLMRMQRYEAAKETFQKLLEEEPACYEAYMHLGNACVNLEQMDEAIAAFKSALLVRKDDGEALFSIANVYYLKDELKDAVQYYMKAEEAGYHTADMYTILSQIFYHTGDRVGALRYLSKALREQPLSGELWRQRVLLELELGKTDTALDTLDEFESILPDALDIHELRTRILIELGKPEEAEVHLRRALEAFPQDVRLLLLEIHLYAAQDKLQEAKAEIAALKAQGLDAGYRKQIALEEAGVCVKATDVPGLVAAIRWGLEESPDDPDLLFVLLQTYISTLDYANIIQLADQILAHEGLEPSVVASAAFYRALSLRQTGRTEEATASFRKLARTLRKLCIDRPDSVDLFIYRILTHNALKEYDQAFQLADYLGKISPDPKDVHAFRSLIYKDMGDEEKAKEEVELARQIDPDFKG